MSWFSNLLSSSNPSANECVIYKEALDFVISNLKYSLVHHQARVDGTMIAGWNEEEKILQGQIDIMSKFDDRRSQITKKSLEMELEKVRNMLKSSSEPNEAQRLQGMCDMHNRFVRTLESLVPLLHEKCPYDDIPKK